jgi:hypothetical protein
MAAKESPKSRGGGVEGRGGEAGGSGVVGSRGTHPRCCISCSLSDSAFPGARRCPGSNTWWVRVRATHAAHRRCRTPIGTLRSKALRVASRMSFSRLQVTDPKGVSRTASATRGLARKGSTRRRRATSASSPQSNRRRFSGGGPSQSVSHVAGIWLGIGVTRDRIAPKRRHNAVSHGAGMNPASAAVGCGDGGEMDELKVADDEDDVRVMSGTAFGNGRNSAKTAGDSGLGVGRSCGARGVGRTVVAARSASIAGDRDTGLWHGDCLQDSASSEDVAGACSPGVAGAVSSIGSGVGSEPASGFESPPARSGATAGWGPPRVSRVVTFLSTTVLGIGGVDACW